LQYYELLFVFKAFLELLKIFHCTCILQSSQDFYFSNMDTEVIFPLASISFGASTYAPT
jgi:hypothetical protein